VQIIWVYNETEMALNLHFNNDEAKQTPFRWFESYVVGSECEGSNKASNIPTDIT
jgi:hypothetical protein